MIIAYQVKYVLGMLVLCSAVARYIGGVTKHFADGIMKRIFFLMKIFEFGSHCV